MFNDLFWAVYIIDVLSDLPAFFLIPFVMGAGAVVATLYNEEMPTREEEWGWKQVWKTCFVIGLLIALVIIVVPSKNTMYVMLGTKTTEGFLDTDTGKKIQKLIDLQMDKFLKASE